MYYMYYFVCYLAVNIYMAAYAPSWMVIEHLTKPQTILGSISVKALEIFCVCKKLEYAT